MSDEDPEARADSEQELPRPHAGLSPREKGELLVRYVLRGRANQQAASGLEDLDFSGAEMADVELIAANLKGAQLQAADFSRADLTAACLDSANLDHARLQRVNLSGASLRDSSMVNAYLDSAQLGGAKLVRTNLLYATIARADFTEANLWGVRLEGAEGTPRDRRAAHLDAETYRRSGWTPAHLTEWLRAGAVIENFADFPADAQLAVFREFEGLILFLSTRLLPWDQTVLHAFVCSVLGLDTDVRIAEYVENPSGESCRVRLVGSNINDLISVAEHITRIAWRTEQNSAEHAIEILNVQQVLTSLDYIRAHVERLELWEKQRRNSEDALEDAKMVLKRSWGTDLLRAGADHLLNATGIKSLIEAGIGAASRVATTMAEAKNQRDIEKWEVAVARHELEKVSEDDES